MSDDLNTEIKIGADASGVEAGVGRAKRSLSDLGVAAKKAGKDAGDGVGSIGAGGDKAARDVERATKSMQGSLQRLLAEQKAGAKGSREYYEALADTRGISRNAIKPILDQIDAAKSKTLQAKTAADSWTASLGKVGPLVAAAFSGAAITSFLGKVVSVQREFDVLNSSLKTVTGSSAAAEREMSWLKDFAKETPFGLAQATQGFVKMKALGLDPTRAALTSFGNTASAMGKDLNQMIEAVADASTGEFERLKEFGIKAKKEGDNVSLTFQGVTTTIGNSAREITKYLENIGNTSFGGAMEERAKTLDGTIAALGDTWDELFRTVSTNNVGGLIFDSVTLANGALEDATNILRALGGAAQDAGRDTGALSTIQNGIATVFETVAVLGANLKFVLVGIGNEIGGLAAQVAQAAQFNFSGVAAIRRQMVSDAEAARKEIDATTARILNARKAQEEYARYATRNASAATDPRRVDLGGSTQRATGGGVSSGAAKAVKETISEYDKLIKKLSDELPRAAAEAEAAQMGYNKAQTEFLALAGSDVWAKFSTSERARVAAMYEGKIASEQSADAAKELSKAYAEAAAERIKTIQSMERAADGLQSQNDALREEIELIGLSTEQQTLVLQQRNDVIILTKEATLAELERQSAITGTQTRVEIALASEIEALKERNALLGAKGVKNAAVDAAKTAKDEWQKTTDSINQSLTDSLLRGFESGKDFAKNLRDTVINMFNTMVLRPVISAVMSPISGAINGAVSGAAGSAGGGMLSSMGGSVIGNALGGVGAFGIGASYGATSLFANGLGATLSAGSSMIGAGSVMSGIGTIAGALGPIALGIGALHSIISSLDDSGTYHTGGAAQYSGADGLRTSLGPEDKDQFGIGMGWFRRGDQTISAVSAIAQGLGTALDGVAVAFGQKAGYEVATAFADDSSKDGAWGAMRISKDGQELLNWEDTRKSKWAPREFANGEDGYKEYLAAIAKDTRKVLLDMDLPSWADTMLESIGEAANMEQLSATLQQIGAIQTTFVNLGKTIDGFAGLTDKSFEALMRASGGLESLAANAGTYYENFYSEAEKTAAVTRSVSDALAQVGLVMPTTRDEFRALVESQLALGESGAEAVAALLGVSGAFASVVPAAEEASTAIGEILSEAMKRLQSDTAGLEIDLLRAQGNTTGANAAQRTLDTTGFTEAEIALYDYNAALRAQISALADAQAAAAQAAENMRALRSSLIGLESSFTGGGFSRQYQAQDAAGEVQSLLAGVGIQKDAGQLTAAILSATSGEVEAYFREIWQVLDTDEARQKLVNVTGSMLELARGPEQEAAQRAQERYGIEGQLLQLQGNTAALRARELALLDPANRADQLRVYLLQDAQEAAKAAADAERDLSAARVQSAQDAYRAAQDATGGAFDALSRSVNAERSLYESARAAAADAAQEIKAVIDTLSGSIQDLYAGVDSTRQASAVEGSAFIARALQAARTTGYLPDAKGLSDAISQARGGLGSQNFATQFEADRAQLVMAGQLSELSDIAKPQLTAAERTLRNAEDQLKALDDILKNAQAQVDAVRGISTTVGTIPAALAGLQAALLSEAQAKALAQATTPPPATAPTTPTGGALSGPYASQITDAIKAAAYTADDRLVYDTARMLGVTSSELDKLMGWTAGTSLDWAKRNNLPAFAVGTNYVPRDMVATIHEGEAIVPKAFNPWAAGGQGMGGGNTEVVAELRALRQQNERLEARLASIEGSNNTMVSLLDDVTDGGNAMRSEVMA